MWPTGGKLAYHPILDYATIVTKYNVGKATMDDVRAFVRESIEKNMVGGYYAPLMQPFGDEVTLVMTQEFVKVCLEYTGDPA